MDAASDTDPVARPGAGAGGRGWYQPGAHHDYEHHHDEDRCAPPTWLDGREFVAAWRAGRLHRRERGGHRLSSAATSRAHDVAALARRFRRPAGRGDLATRRRTFDRLGLGRSCGCGRGLYGGFKKSAGAGGAAADGVTLEPLVAGDMTLALDAAGHWSMGVGGRRDFRTRL